MALQTDWAAEGWEATLWAGFLVLTNPQGESGLVQLRDAATSRNITGPQFRAAVSKAGPLKACQVFWKLRAQA